MTYPSFASLLTPTMTQAEKVALHGPWLAGLNALAARTYAPEPTLTPAQEKAAQAQLGRFSRRQTIKERRRVA